MSSISSKVVAGGAAGAASIIIVWLLSVAGVEVPTEVGQALTVLISFGAGYLKKEQPTTVTVRTE